MSRETAARLFRLTQARIGDTLHDGDGTRVAIVNAFTTVNPRQRRPSERSTTRSSVRVPKSSACIRTTRTTSRRDTGYDAFVKGWCAGVYTGPPDRPSLRP